LLSPLSLRLALVELLLLLLDLQQLNRNGIVGRLLNEQNNMSLLEPL